MIDRCTGLYEATAFVPDGRMPTDHVATVPRPRPVSRPCTRRRHTLAEFPCGPGCRYCGEPVEEPGMVHVGGCGHVG